MCESERDRVKLRGERERERERICVCVFVCVYVCVVLFREKRESKMIKVEEKENLRDTLTERGMNVPEHTIQWIANLDAINKPIIS